jgi:hypothetical protein
MLSGVWAGHQQGPEQVEKSLALGTQLPVGTVGRGLVSHPVSKIVVHPIGMPVMTSMVSDMPNTPRSSILLARLFTGLSFLVFMVPPHLQSMGLKTGL